MYGLTAKDLQSELVIRDDSVGGILSYVPEYSGYSSVPSEQSGYYLALSFETNPGAEITTELVNGTGGIRKVADGFCVYRIMDTERQIIRVSAEKNGETLTKEYSLSQLILGDWVLDSEKEKMLDDQSGLIQASDPMRSD